MLDPIILHPSSLLALFQQIPDISIPGVPTEYMPTQSAAAVAKLLLTILGAAGESLGFDRLLKANTVKKRTHSLFRQGVLYFRKLPNMRSERKIPLLIRFAELLSSHTLLAFQLSLS